MKYYKLMKENENHNGFQYKNGLNTDTLEFNPSGSCEPGGLYFADAEHILENLYAHHCYIREVTIPDNEEIYEDPSSYKYKAHSIKLGRKRDLRKLTTWKWMVKEGINIHASDDYVLIFATHIGNLDIVKYLVEQGVSLNEYNDCILKYAAKNGHFDMLKFLMENGKFVENQYNIALKWAVCDDHLDVVKYLVEQGADIHISDDYPLRWAARHGNLEIVKYLVEQGANIEAECSCALRWAAEFSHLDIVRYLKEELKRRDEVKEYYFILSTEKINNISEIGSSEILNIDNIIPKLKNEYKYIYILGKLNDPCAITYKLISIKELNDIETWKYLIDKGLNINDDYNYIFKWASFTNNLPLVKYLLDDLDFDLYLKWFDLDESAYCFMTSGNLEGVKYLLSKGARLDEEAVAFLPEENETYEYVKSIMDKYETYKDKFWESLRDNI